jgi:hypothetical protein
MTRSLDSLKATSDPVLQRLHAPEILAKTTSNFISDLLYPSGALLKRS